MSRANLRLEDTVDKNGKRTRVWRKADQNPTSSKRISRTEIQAEYHKRRAENREARKFFAENDIYISSDQARAFRKYLAGEYPRNRELEPATVRAFNKIGPIVGGTSFSVRSAAFYLRSEESDGARLFFERIGFVKPRSRVVFNPKAGYQEARDQIVQDVKDGKEVNKYDLGFMKESNRAFYTLASDFAPEDAGKAILIANKYVTTFNEDAWDRTEDKMYLNDFYYGTAGRIPEADRLALAIKATWINEGTLPILFSELNKEVARGKNAKQLHNFLDNYGR